jgi:CBS domain-containing protein
MMLVKDVMTAKVEWIQPNLTIKEVARLMKDKNIGCVPVGENDRVIGMITDRDLVERGTAEGADPETATARQVMSKGITWCFDDQTLDEAAQLMDERQIHHLPVMNRDKRMIGIVCLADLALKGTPDVSRGVFRLASRDATRHAAASKRSH